MEEEQLVDGSGWISDESSLYGDSARQFADIDGSDSSPLTRDARIQLLQHKEIITNIAAAAGKAQRPRAHVGNPKSDGSTSSAPSKQRNPYEGVKSAYQFAENVGEFLCRLPVSTRLEDIGNPWIWAANPFQQPRPEVSNIGELCEKGHELLEAFTEHKATIEKKYAGKAQSIITRNLTPLREQLKNNIETLAKKTHVISGKWMLFPNADELARTWRLVVEAVVENRLGSAAKAATLTEDSSKDGRLICVYTRDFSDLDDVRRVLEELIDLGLVDRDNTRGIYYKTDAYTHLDISSNNEFGLKASTYWSKKILIPAAKTGNIRPGSTQPLPQKKQSTLDMFHRKA